MSKTRRAKRQMIAHRAAASLDAAERALDAALQELGTICAELPAMRQEAELSAVYGQDLFRTVGQAYAGMVEVRGHVVRLHEGLERVRCQLNLDPTRAGSGTDKPPTDESVVVGLAA